MCVYMQHIMCTLYYAMHTPLHTCIHQQDNKRVHVYTHSITYTPQKSVYTHICTCTHSRDSLYTPEYVYTRTNQTNVQCVCSFVRCIHSSCVYTCTHPKKLLCRFERKIGCINQKIGHIHPKSGHKHPKIGVSTIHTYKTAVPVPGILSENGCITCLKQRF